MKIFGRKIKLMLMLLLVFMFSSTINVYAIGSYTINGTTVRYTDFSSSPNECWDYANKVYRKIWKQSFSSLFNDNSNMLRNLGDNQLTLTPENLKKYVSNASLGSAIRICNAVNLHSHDGYISGQPGHVQIIVQKDANGFAVLEGGLSASPHCREKYYTWNEYCSTGWLGGTYRYIKYIKWPGAPAYSSSQGGSNDEPTISSTSTPYNPEGCLDSLEGGAGVVKIRGWAFDRNSLESSLEIHVYVGGPWNGNPLFGDNSTRANAYRPDVVNVFGGVGSRHGFDATIKVPVTGTYTVYVYAINVGGHVGSNYNTCLGSKTVTISQSDTTPPVISNVKVTADTNGYTVTCNVNDASGIDRVMFPSWTKYNGQDDLIGNDGSWPYQNALRGTVTGNRASFRVNRKDHNNEMGEYITHIYAYDKYGNVSSARAGYTFSKSTTSSSVTKKCQKISANSFIKTLGDKTFSLGAKTSGNGKLSYQSNNTKVATVSSGGKVTIKGIGIATISIRASGTSAYNATTKKITVTVKPKSVSILSLKNSRPKKLQITWKRNSAVTGYMVQVATKSSFKNAKTYKVTSNRTLSKTISATKGKTYYVRICTYKGNLKSSWSSVKKLKIRK